MEDKWIKERLKALLDLIELQNNQIILMREKIEITERGLEERIYDLENITEKLDRAICVLESCE